MFSHPSERCGLCVEPDIFADEEDVPPTVSELENDTNGAADSDDEVEEAEADYDEMDSSDSEMEVDIGASAVPTVAAPTRTSGRVRNASKRYPSDWWNSTAGDEPDD